MFIDTHCHLYDDVFAERKPQVEQLALDQGVKTVLLPNISSKSIPALEAVAEDYPNLSIHKMVGLHPCYVKEGWEEELATLKAYYLSKPQEFVAVGEIGLDLYWDTSTEAIQIQALEEQLEWAVDWDLPIALHVRSSFKQIFPVLEAAQERFEGKLRGVFHCFSGGKKQIKRAMKLGEFYFGVGGSYTYNRAATDAVIQQMPKDRIILETDAPYLVPTAFRGQKNEPGFLTEAAKVVAEVKGEALDSVGAWTTENANRLFSLDA